MLHQTNQHRITHLKQASVCPPFKYDALQAIFPKTSVEYTTAGTLQTA
jgi:hypothetical protein